MKNLPTQTGDGEEKPNDSKRGSAWSEEAQGSIPRRGGDESNAMRRAPPHVVEKMRAMRWERLHSTSWRGWEQCAAAPNWWLVGVEVARSIDDYKGCFLSRPRSSGRVPSDPIFQAVYLQVLSFKPYPFRSYLLGRMPSGSHSFLLSRQLFIFLY